MDTKLFTKKKFASEKRVMKEWIQFRVNRKYKSFDRILNLIIKKKKSWMRNSLLFNARVQLDPCHGVIKIQLLQNTLSRSLTQRHWCREIISLVCIYSCSQTDTRWTIRDKWFDSFKYLPKERNENVWILNERAIERGETQLITR